METGRKKRSVKNIALALFSQFITVLVGMLLPRALMVNYGSETNGLITSLQQMISYLTLIEGGLLSAVAVSLYKPLAENDTRKVNQVLTSAKFLYRNTGVYFCIALILFAVIYPLTIAETQYSYWEVLYMVFLIGINGATQILFIGKYKALLMASQMNGIILAINAGSTALYSIVLIGGAFVHLDLLVALTIAVSAYLVRALIFYIVVKRKLPQYSYSQDCDLLNFPQRGDAFAAQILAMLSLNGSVIVLTLMKAPMTEISIYTTYNLVLSGLYMLMYSIENSVTSSLGDLMAREPIERVRESYEWFDAVYHILWTVIVSCLSVLLLPFIKVYTAGVSDAQYVLPFEAILFVTIGAGWMLRNQLTLLLTAKGFFKNLRKAMSVEALIVLLGGSVFFLVMGLKGMLIAKIVSVVYMIVQLSCYTYKGILEMSMKGKIKRISLSVLVIVIMSMIGANISKGSNESLIIWFMQACIVALTSALVTICVWRIFAKREFRAIMTKVVGRTKR